MCGAAGLGHRWGQRTGRVGERHPGDCDGLRDYINRLKNGRYQDTATSMLAAQRVTTVETWEPAQERLNLFVGQAGVFPSRATDRG